jgi:hypothetical protein
MYFPTSGPPPPMEPIGSLLALLTHPCKLAGKSIIDISVIVAELWLVRIRLVVVSRLLKEI